MDRIKESMAMWLYRMIEEVDFKPEITIAASENQISQIKAWLGDVMGISLERTRGTHFP